MADTKSFVTPKCFSNLRSGSPSLSAEDVFSTCNVNSICLYKNTSGSTSVPKTFGVTWKRVYNLAMHYGNDANERRTLRTGSIEFDAHRTNRLCSLLAGNTCIFTCDLSLEAIISLSERTEVSTIHLGAYRLDALIKAEPSPSRRLPAFTSIQTGGSRVPGRLRKNVQRLLTDKLWVLYATSEIGAISLAHPDQHDRYPEGVGFPMRGVTVEIVNQDGQPVEPGCIGKIRARRATMASGYVNDQAGGFEDGWCYPGDLLSQRYGEPLIFHGRADDVIILNGMIIFPSAIEDTLENHPDVKEAVAFPVESRIHGAIPVAAVVLRNTIEANDVGKLMDFARSVLGLRAPRDIFVVDHIPRNAAGKPVRREMGAIIGVSGVPHATGS